MCKKVRHHAAVIVWLALTSAILAQEVPNEKDWKNYEPVLYPIAVATVTGANGTLWEDEGLMRNTSEEPRLWGQGLLSIPASRVLPPGAMGPGAGPNTVPIDGSLIWIQKGKASDYSFSSRLFERTRPENADGIEVPVVTLDEAFSETFEILRVPVTGEHRLMLRVYDLWSTPGGTVSIELHVLRIEGPSVATNLIQTFRLPMDLWSWPSSPSNLTFTPGFVRLQLDGHIPPDIKNVRISIKPETEGQMIWAFVSLTHNVTQRVSIVTPQ